MRWQNCELHEDTWQSVKTLENSQEVINQYESQKSQEKSRISEKLSNPFKQKNTLCLSDFTTKNRIFRLRPLSEGVIQA